MCVCVCVCVCVSVGVCRCLCVCVCAALVAALASSWLCRDRPHIRPDANAQVEFMTTSVLDDDLTLMEGTVAPLITRDLCVRVVDAIAERAHRRCIQVGSSLWTGSRPSRNARTYPFDRVSL